MKLIRKGDSGELETTVNAEQMQVRIKCISQHKSHSEDFRGLQCHWVFDYSDVGIEEILRRAAEFDKITFRRTFRNLDNPEDMEASLNGPIPATDFIPKRGHVSNVEKLKKLGLSREDLESLLEEMSESEDDS